VWENDSYRDFLSENTRRHHGFGSALIMLAAAVLMLILIA
jgi:hypothetical protein